MIKKTTLKKSCLATMITLCSVTTVHALEVLSDASLSDMTGEGIALLPENFKMVFQAPNDLSAASSYGTSTSKAALLTASQKDTGFIRIIPTGENYAGLASTVTAATAAAMQTKADIFIYGLALSKSDSDLNVRYSNQGFTWGSAENPWLFRAGTAASIQQFQSSNTAADVGYLALEAPLATVAADDSDNNIKLGFWTDMFSRKWGSSNIIDPITGAPKAVVVTNDATNDQNLDKNQRLRLQFVANGLSLNGSQIRLFQTQTSSITQQNQTLGMASIVRINTNDSPENVRSTDTNLAAKAIRIGTATTSTDKYSTPALSKSEVAPTFHETEGLYLYSPNINLVLGNMYQPFVLGSSGKNIILEVTAIPNVESIYNKIYTVYTDTEATYSADKAGTYYKAKDGSYYSATQIPNATTFYKKTLDANNLPVYTADSTGTYVKNNVTGGYVELTGTSKTTPNKYKISNQTALDTLSSQYKGSTCNVNVCGTNTSQVNGVTYQGTNATHSSISLGTVSRDIGTNTLIANRDSNATGVMFKSSTAGATPVNLGSVAIDGVLIQHLKFTTTGL